MQHLRPLKRLLGGLALFRVDRTPKRGFCRARFRDGLDDELLATADDASDVEEYLGREGGEVYAERLEDVLGH